MISQAIPSPELVADIGVVGYLLIVVVVAGAGTGTWFLKRMADAMDRMAIAQEIAPTMLAEIRALLSARLDAIDEKLDKAVVLAEEHVSIARMWRATEAPGRKLREDSP